MKALPAIDKGDTLLAVTTLSFDIAALELLLPLIVGACVVVVGREVASDGERLLRGNRRRRCDVPPGDSRHLASPSRVGLGRPAGLDDACGGETLPRELADRLVVGDRALWNLYGPTETTVWSVNRQGRERQGPVSIGRPILNDATVRPRRPASPGPRRRGRRAVHRRRGLARGYLNRPGLTAERFLPDPFADEPGHGSTGPGTSRGGR